MTIGKDNVGAPLLKLTCYILKVSNSTCCQHMKNGSFLSTEKLYCLRSIV